MVRCADSPLATHVSFFLNLNVASVSNPSAIPHSTITCSHNSFQPAPRRMTPRAESIIHVVGNAQEIWRNSQGIDVFGKMYPDRKMHGMTVPNTICDAASRVLARVEISSPRARHESANGRAIARSVKKLPWMGT